MRNSFNLYPILSNEQTDRAFGPNNDFSFFYFDNGEECRLSLEDKSDEGKSFSANLRDPKCNWYPETHDLFVRRSIEISDTSDWFGPNGVVPRQATMGVAVQWMSMKSETRGVIPVGDFRANDTKKRFEFDYCFPQNSIKGSLILTVVVYLKKLGEIGEGEEYLCNQTGTIMGSVDCIEVYVDGNGSLFPIATINDPKLPLWTLYYDDSADPMIDAFDQEHVEVRLNQAHPCYDQLRIDSTLKESPLFLEVISSALLIITETVKEALGSEWDLLINGEIEPDEGSIASAVKYFIEHLRWDASSPLSLAQTIHRFFDDNLQGGNL